MKYYICVGDKTSGGGTVLEGDSGHIIMDRPAAMVGMKVQCCNAIQTIIQGCDSYLVQGKKIAYHGCLISCGCTLISSQDLVGWDDGSNDSSSQQSNDFENRIIQDSPQKYRTHLQLVDENNQPIVNRKYRLTAIDGTTVEGVSNEMGETELIWTHEQEIVNIEILDDGMFDGYHYTDKG